MTAEPEAPEPPAAADPTPSGMKALAGRGREQLAASQARIEELLERHQDHPVIDIGLRIYQRDRESAGTVVGSAIAFRLFLFFIPLLLFVVGVLGFLAELIGDDEIEDAGITGSLAAQIDTALTQPNSTRWIATLAGLIGMTSAGRTLSKVLVAASCLAWQAAGPRQGVAAADRGDHRPGLLHRARVDARQPGAGRARPRRRRILVPRRLRHLPGGLGAAVDAPAPRDP